MDTVEELVKVKLYVSPEAFRDLPPDVQKQWLGEDAYRKVEAVLKERGQ